MKKLLILIGFMLAPALGYGLGAFDYRYNPWSGRLDIVHSTSSINYAIGVPFAVGTSSSVLYIDGDGNLAEDNPNFIWDEDDNKLFIKSSQENVIRLEGSVWTSPGAGIEFYNAQFIGNPAKQGDFGATVSSNRLSVRDAAEAEVIGFNSTGIYMPTFTANSIPYVNGSQYLAENNPGFTYDGTDLTLSSGAVTVTLPSTANRTRTDQFTVEGYSHDTDATNALFNVNHLASDGNRYLLSAQTLGVDKFYVDNDGDGYFAGGLTLGTIGIAGATANVSMFSSANNGVKYFTYQPTNLERGKWTFGQDGVIFLQDSPAKNINFDYVTIKRDVDMTSTYTLDGYLLKLEDTVVNPNGGTYGYLNVDGNLLIDSSGNLNVIDNIEFQMGTAGATDYKQYFDGTNAILYSAGDIIIEKADTGWAAGVNADDFVVEGTGHTGITIFAGADKIAAMYFGDSNVDVGGITYNHTGNILTLRTLDFDRFILDHSAWKVVVPSLTLGSNFSGGSLTDATRKLGRMFVPHYTNAELPVNVFLGDSDGTDNKIGFGDGSANGVKATEIRFSVAENDTTQGSGAVDNSNVKLKGVVGGGVFTIGTAGTGVDVSSFSTNGSLIFVGAAGLPHAEIYAYDANATITISGTGIANKIQVTAFDTNGLSNNATPDHTNDHITVVKAGVYKANVSISVASTGGSAYEAGFAIYKNNGATLFQNCHVHRNLSGGGGDLGSLNITGLIDLTVDDTIELWTWNEDNTNNIIIDDVTMNLIQVGG